MDCQLNQKQELQACMNNTPQTEGSFILRGQAGNGIIDIQKTSSEGLVDTYTIYYTNGETDTFTVTNGKDGAGDVQSVNGQIGDVVLTASDVGALPDSTVIPEAQIQSDWTQADNTKVDYIKNKPTIPVDSDLVHKTGTETISGTKTFTGNPVFKATAYNQCITIERDGTLGSFVAFKNSNGAIGAIGTHANQIPMYANYNNTDTRALVRAGEYTTSAPDAHVGDATTPVYIDANGVAQTCTIDLSNYADKALSNLTNGLSNTICTTPPTTTSTASSSTPAVVVENYVNGSSWYRVWSDGWCEQGGRAGTDVGTVLFLVEFKDTNYNLQLRRDYNSNTSLPGVYWNAQKTTSSFSTQSSVAFDWVTCGYIN